MSNNRIISEDNTGTVQTDNMVEFESGTNVQNTKFYGNNVTGLSGSRIVDNGVTGYQTGSNAV